MLKRCFLGWAPVNEVSELMPKVGWHCDTWGQNLKRGSALPTLSGQDQAVDFPKQPTASGTPDGKSMETPESRLQLYE